MDEEEWSHEKVERFKEQRRCMKCKRRTFEEMIVCENCLEFQYCSIECLEAHREAHESPCNKIALRKGRILVHIGEEAAMVDRIRSKARLLDDSGDIISTSSQNSEEEGDDGGPHMQSQKQGTSKSSKSKKKRKSKRGHGKKQKNGKNGSENSKPSSPSSEKTTKPLPAESLMSEGQFGGPIRCDKTTESGTKFGEDWWKGKPFKSTTENRMSSKASDKQTKNTGAERKPSSDSKPDSGTRFGEDWWKSSPQKPKSKDVASSKTTTKQGNTQGAKAKAEAKPPGPSAKPKFSDWYSDSDDEEINGARSKEKASARDPASASATGAEGASASGGASLEEAMSGLELVKYDAKKADEEMARSREERAKSAKIDACTHCGKVGPVKTCSRCGVASYCDKECQTLDWQGHKAKCKHIQKFKTVLSKLPMPFRMMHNLGERISPLLSDLPNPFERMLLGAEQTIILEIIGPHPHLFRHGAMLRDMAGQVTQVLFYTDSDVYIHRNLGLLGMDLPIPLSRCLRPGNFILILNTHWHHFLDGTVGIRVNDLESVYFIFMND